MLSTMLMESNAFKQQKWFKAAWKKFSGFIREFHRQKLYDSCWRKHCLFAEQNPYREIGESLSWKMLYQCCFRYVCYFAFHGKKIVLLIVIRLIRKL